MAFFTNLNSWTKSLYLITISKRIDLKRSALRHFVDNELYFQFPLNFSQFPFVRYVFYAFKDRTKSTEYLQLTDYGDAHFKLLPFLNELSYNFLLGLDLKNFRRSFKRSLIFCIFIEAKPVKGIRNRHVRFFLLPWLFIPCAFTISPILSLSSQEPKTILNYDPNASTTDNDEHQTCLS